MVCSLRLHSKIFLRLVTYIIVRHYLTDFLHD